MRRVRAMAALGILGLLLGAPLARAADDQPSSAPGSGSEAPPAPDATPKGKWSRHGHHGQHHGRHHHGEGSSSGSSTSGGDQSPGGGSSSGSEAN